MNKEQVLRKLAAISNQITCMNPSEFDKLISDDMFEFECVQMSWGEKTKVSTKICMKKHKVEEEDL